MSRSIQLLNFNLLRNLNNKNSINKIFLNEYSRASGNILRNRYVHRNKNGSFKEYNESITIIPEKYKNQDEYKREKKVDELYKREHMNKMKHRERLYTVKLEDEKSDLDMEKENLRIFNKHLEEEASNQGDQLESTCEDKPFNLEKDPFKKPMHQCIFCKNNIPLDYKNTQLLSQFISPHTGIVYSQQVTGLCHHKQTELENTVFKARKLGLMPFFFKETTYVNDPKLFNPFSNNLKRIEDNFDKRKFNSKQRKE